MSGRTGGYVDLEGRLRRMEKLTVRCALCRWTRTGMADELLELQRAHAETHYGTIAASGNARTGRPRMTTKRLGFARLAGE